MKRNKEGVRQLVDGSFECIWMRAGVLDFKLCDREYDCENCPLDKGIRCGAKSRDLLSGGARLDQTGVERRREGAFNVHGYFVPDSLFYHPRHTWLRVEEGGRVRVGLDDFGQKLSGRVYSVALPPSGSEVGPESSHWRIVHRAGETVLTIPVNGTVEEVNGRLVQQPSLINREPYTGGSSLVIRPVDLVADLKNLHYGRQAESWFESETHVLHGALMQLLTKYAPGLGHTLQDGGVHIEDLSAEIGVEELRRLIDRFLSVSGDPFAGEPSERRK
jgi:glycine cleavage system H lipoate-binding protein